MPVIKHHSQNKVGEERVYFILDLNVYHRGKPEKELKARTQRRETDAGPRRNSAHWLALHGLFSLLSYSTRDYMSGGGAAHSELDPPPINIINQEDAPQANLVGSFLN